MQPYTNLRVHQNSYDNEHLGNRYTGDKVCLQTYK